MVSTLNACLIKGLENCIEALSDRFIAPELPNQVGALIFLEEIGLILLRLSWEKMNWGSIL
jgi:hypothetical protein